MMTFVEGLLIPFRAASLILRNRKLLLLSLIPVLITIGIYTFVLVDLGQWIQAFIQGYFLKQGWTEYGWLTKLLSTMTWLLLALASVVTFSFIANIVAIPFNDFLAEKAESVVGLPAPTHTSISRRLVLIWLDLLKSISAMLLAFGAFLISWVPGLNIIALIFGALLITFEFVTYPQTRRGVGLRDSVSFLFHHFGLCLGFGTMLSVLFSIPLLSWLVLPLAVVGGAILFERADRPVT